MKTSIKNFFLLAALVPGLTFILPGQATAQNLATLYNFTGGGDGGNPYAGLIVSGATLYGTTSGAANFGEGTVFAVNTNGTGFTTLYAFTGGGDGANPNGGLVLSSNVLYGTTCNDGAFDAGTVFAVNTDGSGFTTLYSFSGSSDGAQPIAGLVLSGNTLYGTCLYGGASGNGAVFSVNTDGAGFTTLYSFTAPFGDAGVGGFGTNGDGAFPWAGLILSDATLYGTTIMGGSAGNGTVFALATDGSGFTTLYSFTATTGTAGEKGLGANSDGASPYSALLLSGNTLYGTASEGGGSGNGTVFSINTDGNGFAVLHNFSATSAGTGLLGFVANSDGALPSAALILAGNTLYGTAEVGGAEGNGTVFAVNTDGTAFTTLHSFTGTTGNPGTNNDGADPLGGLILLGNTLYGTASLGGTSAFGTVFSLSLSPVTAPQLNISLSGTNVVLTWPAPAAGFILQSTASVDSPPAAWSAVSPAPVVLDGQNTVTNSISGAQQFYRLSQ